MKLDDKEKRKLVNFLSSTKIVHNIYVFKVGDIELMEDWG